MPKEKFSVSTGKEEAKPHRKNWFILGLLGIVVIALLASSVYFYIQYQASQQLLKNPSIANQDQVNILVQKVGKHYDLPSGDQVTVATVSDVTKLQGQTFFTKAQNGDKVLIYPKSGIAILYRPTIDKIVNVGPVNTQGDTSQTTPTSAPTNAVVKVALYNGTKTNGLTTKVADALTTFSSVKTSVTTKSNATNNYADSLIVDLTGKNAQAATQLAIFAKGKVGSLPAGETKPTGTDILIILGTSYAGTSVTPTPTP